MDGMRALLEGRFEQAEALNRQSLAWILRNPEPVTLAKAEHSSPFCFFSASDSRS